MTIDKSRLKALAEAVRDRASEWQPNQATWAYHEALRDPATVLDLLAEIDALQGLYRMHKETETREMRDLKAENEALKSQIEAGSSVTLARFDFDAEWTAVRKDAERYRWLRKCTHFDMPQHQVFCKAYGDALDEEIDAAMSKEPSHD